MRHLLCRVLGLLLIACSAFPGQALVISGGPVLAFDGKGWLEGRAVVVEAGRITRVAAAKDVEIPKGALRIDLQGRRLIPGLIDLHSHLLLYPYDQRSWNDQVLKESVELRTIRGVVAARKTLDAGFTTLRDLGTEGAGYADVAIRDAVRKGVVPGPRIFASTRAIVATGCYGPSGFAHHCCLPKGAEVADGIDGVRKAVRRQIANGADWIKVYADYRRRPGEGSTPTFSKDELAAIRSESRSAGIPLAAHAVTDEAIRRCIEIGVDTIEHGYEASFETLVRMAELNVTLCPTLAANEAIARYRGWRPGQPDSPRIKQAKATFLLALQSKVRIACGSDVGVFAHGTNARELELMVAYGMDAGRALRSATTVAARVLRRERELGQITPGFRADLVAVRGDPLQDPSAVRTPWLVVKDGRVHLNRLP